MPGAGWSKERNVMKIERRIDAFTNDSFDPEGIINTDILYRVVQCIYKMDKDKHLDPEATDKPKGSIRMTADKQDLTMEMSFEDWSFYFFGEISEKTENYDPSYFRSSLGKKDISVQQYRSGREGLISSTVGIISGPLTEQFDHPERIKSGADKGVEGFDQALEEIVKFRETLENILS